MLYRSILLFLLLPVVAMAEMPKAIISGPVEAVPGDFIDLDGSESIGDFFLWKIEPSQYPDGRKTFRYPKASDGSVTPPQKNKNVSLANRPGKYHITLIVSNADGIAIGEWDVLVLPPPGAPQTPTVPQTPTQPPIVVNPPPQTPTVPTIPTTPVVSDLTTWVRNNLFLVTDSQKTTNKLSLAEVYRNWSVSGARASSPEDYATAQSLLVNSKLNQMGVFDGWDAFLKALAVKLSSMNLTTIPANQTASGQIADGLER